MKYTDLAAENDTSFEILWEQATGVAHRIKEGLEFRWKVWLVDVLCQSIEVLWVLSF